MTERLSAPRTDRPAGARRALRVVAGIGVGLVLAGSAYQSTLAGTRGLPDLVRQPIGRQADYDTGLPGGALVPIAVGGAVAMTAAVTGAFGAAAAAAAAPGAEALLLGAPVEVAERLPILPAEHDRILELRIVPKRLVLPAGTCGGFHLEARSAIDRKWYSVTHRREASLELREASRCVVKQSGSRNVFCVPITVPAECDGQEVPVVGSFALPGQPPMTAEAVIVVLAGRSRMPGATLPGR